MAHFPIRQKYLLRIFIIAIAALVLSGGTWIGLYYALRDDRVNVENAFASGQLDASRQLAYDLRDSLVANLQAGSGLQGAEQSAIRSVMERQEASASRYAFWYSPDGVLFERSEAEAKKYTVSSLKGLFDKWGYEGGSGFAAEEDEMLSRISGTGRYIRAGGGEEEIVSWTCFTVQGHAFIAGYSASEPFVAQAYKIGEHSVRINIIAGLLTLAFLVAALLLCIRLFVHAKRSDRLSRELSEKNTLIAGMSAQLREDAGDVEKASTYDPLTGLYNRYFFDALFPKLDIPLFLPVSVLYLDINGLRTINEREGFQAGDRVLQAVGSAIKDRCRDSDIAARLGNDEFCMIMVNTGEKEAEKIADAIQQQAREMEERVEVRLPFGLAAKHTQEERLADVIGQAEKNLSISKLLEEGSARRSVVTVLQQSMENAHIETHENQERVRIAARKIGEALGLPEMALKKLEIAAVLRDIGKISIPDSILQKQAPLTEGESRIVRKHCEIGSRIASASPDLQEISGCILQHHERYDGKGYPQGLAGEQIDLLSRVIAVADSFVSMTSPRSYREAMTPERAVVELRRCSGTQFDPKVVRAFVEAGAWREKQGGSRLRDAQRGET